MWRKQDAITYTAWQRMSTRVAKDDFEAATDLYYINVSKQ
jgi:hypothetical protein